ncbi:hypothetical protein [Candidatus Spongiihabitans sp.]|uniref:hypothetical protein n=1 Tax=Candidatus Spongiihabitans sp. TaxID=3101308 RepID=UPI003C7A3DE0
MKNKYVIRCRISENKFRAIPRLFCLDIEACKVAQITGISGPAISRLYTQIRQHIAGQCERRSPATPDGIFHWIARPIIIWAGQ